MPNAVLPKELHRPTLADAMEPNVKVYTTSSCIYCVRAKALLAQRNIAYEEIDVGGDDEMRAWLVRATGGRRTVPQLFINGEPIGGFDELRELDRTGGLESRLRIASDSDAG